jgi:hypothetical protein
MDNNNMKYRNIKYSYHEWKTWTGKLATGYHCEDKALLKGLNTVSFGTKTINEMQETIDDYIDNRQEHFDDQQQYDLAELEFMNKYGTLNAD